MFFIMKFHFGDRLCFKNFFCTPNKCQVLFWARGGKCGDKLPSSGFSRASHTNGGDRKSIRQKITHATL